MLPHVSAAPMHWQTPYCLGWAPCHDFWSLGVPLGQVHSSVTRACTNVVNYTTKRRGVTEFLLKRVLEDVEKVLKRSMSSQSRIKLQTRLIWKHRP